MEQNQRQKFDFSKSFTADEVGSSPSSYTEAFTPYYTHAALGGHHESLEQESSIDLDQLIQDAYAQGFQEGRMYAGDTEQSHIGQFVKQFEASFHSYEDGFRSLQRNLNQAVIGIITQVMRQIVQGVPIDLFADRLQKQLHKIHLAIPKADMVVKGHSVCIEIAQKNISTQEFAKQIVFQSDETLSKGDCSIEWPNGGIEVRFDQYIDNVISYLVQPDTVTQLLDRITLDTQQNTGDKHE